MPLTPGLRRIPGISYVCPHICILLRDMCKGSTNDVGISIASHVTFSVGNVRFTMDNFLASNTSNMKEKLELRLPTVGPSG